MSKKTDAKRPMDRRERLTTGIPYFCVMSIDNLEDTTFRILRTLKEADLIAAEDTCHSIKLLDHFDIETPMTNYHGYNKMDKARYPVGRLEEGANIALITDAGTSGISDPGEELVRQCYEAGVQVTSPPSPAACITTPTMSGFSIRRFCLEAFLPSEKGDKKERARILEKLKRETRTTIVYEAPHHLARTLEDSCKVLGDRNITICRELMKKYETACRTMLRESLERCRQEEPRGECVTAIEGRPLEELRKEQISRREDMEIQEHLAYYTDQGMDKKEAMEAAVKDRGVTERDVYQKLL